MGFNRLKWFNLKLLRNECGVGVHYSCQCKTLLSLSHLSLLCAIGTEGMWLWLSLVWSTSGSRQWSWWHVLSWASPSSSLNTGQIYIHIYIKTFSFLHWANGVHSLRALYPCTLKSRLCFCLNCNLFILCTVTPPREWTFHSYCLVQY